MSSTHGSRTTWHRGSSAVVRQKHRAPQSAVPGYARYVGRVGALAVALGVGAAIASTSAVALADEGASSGSGSSNSSAESSSASLGTRQADSDRAGRAAADRLAST